MSDITVVSTREQASAIKRMLRDVFGTSPRFRASSYTSGPFFGIRVTWTDGPERHEVANACKPYRGVDEDNIALINTNLDGTRERYEARLLSYVRHFSTDEKRNAALERSRQR